MLRPERVSVTTAATVALAATLSGCAGSEQRDNQPRPPAPIVITASISKDHVSASPRRFGAGPITLVVTNQTDRSQQITLETADRPGADHAGIRQQTGPINPRDTASLDADVGRGTYTVRTASEAISPARLRVGARRASAQNDLMLP
jgi:hypothetical protein